MELWTFDTPAGRAILRQARAQDIAALIELNRLCFPDVGEDSVVWRAGHLASHQRLFPEGQLVCEVEGRIVGAVASLVVKLGADPYREHSYAGITDGGYFHNHDPQGDTLYGADVYVHPDFRRLGVARQLYAARRRLCLRLGLSRIVAGGRIPGYAQHASGLSPEAYVNKVVQGELADPVLSFQLSEGFVVRKVLRNYITDPSSVNCASFIEWRNPQPTVAPKDGERKLRVAAVQYQVRRLNSFDEFASQVSYFVQAAADYGADFVVFPEFFSVQLLSQPQLRDLPEELGIVRLSEYEGQFLALFTGLAQRHGLHIVAGTHPMRRGEKLLNVSPLFFPDGHHQLQAKLHITPSEKRAWGISGGDEVLIASTAKARVAISICYDVEFPELARYQADNGAEVLFVPFCTDDRQGYVRVRNCAAARAIENQVYVVMAGVVGNLPSVPAMDIHYGRACVLSPSDFPFARDGIQAEAEANVETLLVTDLDLSSLHRARVSGSVTPRLDRRPELFEYRALLASAAQAPLQEAPVGLSEEVKI